jgi:hypothetical protein
MSYCYGISTPSKSVEIQHLVTRLLYFCENYILHIYNSWSPVAARSKAWVCGRLLAGIAGSNPIDGHGYLSIVIVVCCQVEVSATGRSLIQRSPTDLIRRCV